MCTHEDGHNDSLTFAATATFVVKPGRGKEFIYTAVSRNTTLECTVFNTSMLGWLIDRFDPRFHDNDFSGFTAYQSGPTIATTGELTSTLTVNGAVGNSGIEICCQTLGPQECCTNLIIYGIFD